MKALLTILEALGVLFAGVFGLLLGVSFARGQRDRLPVLGKLDRKKPRLLLVAVGGWSSAILQLSLGTACVAQGPTGHTVVTDSGSVRVVTYTRLPDEAGLKWSLDSVPLVSIGEADGEEPYLLSRVVGAVSLGAGYLVADGSSGELRHFDGTGRHLLTVGGTGSGPGEFVLLRWVGKIRGDSILVWDLRNRRLTFFDPSLRLVRTEPLNPPTPYVMAGAFGDGDVLVWPFGPLTSRVASAQIVQVMMALAVARPGSASLDTIIRLPAQPIYLQPSGSVMRVPFTRDPSFAVDDMAVWAGDSSTGELARYSKEGVAEVIVRLPPGGTIGSEDVEAYRSRDLQRYSGSELAERRRLLDEIPFPSELPAFDRIRAGSGGQVWVRRYPRRGDQVHRWIIFDGSGAQVGQLDIPATEVLAVSGVAIITLWRDELGVERIRVYRFTTP